MNWFIILIYIVLAIGIFTFLRISDLRWNGRPLVRLPIRLAIALIVPFILIAAFILFIYLFIIIALIIVVVFVMGMLGRKR